MTRIRSTGAAMAGILPQSLRPVPQDRLPGGQGRQAFLAWCRRIFWDYFLQGASTMHCRAWRCYGMLAVLVLAVTWWGCGGGDGGDNEAPHLVLDGTWTGTAQ